MLLDNQRGLLIEDSAGSPTTVLTKDTGNTVWLGNRSASGGIGFRVWNSIVSTYVNAMHIDEFDGQVGIGTDDPLAGLHVMGDSTFADILITPDEPGANASSALKLGEDNDYTYGMTLRYDGAANQFQFDARKDGASLGPCFVIERDSGNVGVGELSPIAKLDVLNPNSGSAAAIRGYASGTTGTNYGLIGICNSPDGYAGWFVGNSSFMGNTTFDTPGAGEIEFRLDGVTPGINVNGGHAGTLRLRRALEIWPNDAGDQAGYFDVRDASGAIKIAMNGTDGRVTTGILEITGGSDLSEQFDIGSTDVAPGPGMVVCIDPDSPGQLLVSTRAYDRTVAGVVSGAGGVQTGMLMGQRSTIADGQHAVALTGRVYVLADASNGRIEPGDRLTTSASPGHAMKATDSRRAAGAVIGKAMSPLAEGRGLVLVLIQPQ